MIGTTRRDFIGMAALPVQGHAVANVAPMGRGWKLFVLSAEDDEMRILHCERMA